MLNSSIELVQNINSVMSISLRNILYVCRVLLDQMVAQDNRDLRDQMEMMDHQAQPDQEEDKDHQ